MSIEEIMKANEEAGFFFFSAGAMRFFNSRVSSYTRGRFFITSERLDMEFPRLYSVRYLDEKGSVTTINDFQEYATLEQAKRALDNAYIEQLEECDEATIEKA